MVPGSDLLLGDSYRKRGDDDRADECYKRVIDATADVGDRRSFWYQVGYAAKLRSSR
ncbi:tetratricopeptide repeat protein [Escherichia coli]|uniref:tetratricopeptide repeat protein n=1 Tax=Escherichia coli TaxID=562 RepID=UPI00391F614C